MAQLINLKKERKVESMKKFTKITVGFITQGYKRNAAGKFVCIGQEFIAGDQVDYEDLDGNTIKAPEYEYQQFNMTLVSKDEIINRLGDVITSIDVGGEQSRQFSYEIKILDELLRDLGWIPKD